MTEVWFIRHGESTTNAGAVSKDRSSTELTELGREQAKAVSLLIPSAPALIVVTPYIRTHQTAAPLRARYPHSPVEEWPLQEFSALADENYSNRTWVERIPLMKAYWEKSDPHHIDGPGAESFAQMVARVQAGFKRLHARPEKFIVVYAHGYILQVVRLLLVQPYMQMAELMQEMYQRTKTSHIENGTIIRLIKSTDGFHIHADDLKDMQDKGPQVD